MRSIKSMLLLALAAMATAVLVAPGVAAAEEWTKEGKDFSESLEWVYTDQGFPVAAGAGNIALEGKIRFGDENAGGGWRCTLKANGTLGASTNVGSITEASITSCKPEGVYGACKITSSTVSGLPWSLFGGANKIATGLTFTLKQEGFFCSPGEVTFSGGFIATLDNQTAMSKWTFSGEVESNLGPMKVTDSVNVTPAARYGIERTVTTALSGDLHYTSPLGGNIDCGAGSVTATQALREGGGGAIKSFAVNPAKCSGSGILSSCTVTSVTQKNAPWPITNEGTKVKISNFGFQMNMSGGFCPSSFIVEGTMNQTPAFGQVNAISQVSLAGTTTTLGNGTNYAGNWTGTWNWSPAGVYGL